MEKQLEFLYWISFLSYGEKTSAHLIQHCPIHIIDIDTADAYLQDNMRSLMDANDWSIVFDYKVLEIGYDLKTPEEKKAKRKTRIRKVAAPVIEVETVTIIKDELSDYVIENNDIQPKRCLIENDMDIDVGEFGQFGRFKSKYLNGGKMSEFFDIIVTSASDNKLDVLKAIVSCEEIWVDSSYVGNSERLFMLMLLKAKELNLKDKVVINMRKFMDVAWHIPDEAKPLIHELRKENNIQFVYADDKEYDNYLPLIKKS